MCNYFIIAIIYPISSIIKSSNYFFLENVLKKPSFNIDILAQKRNNLQELKKKFIFI